MVDRNFVLIIIYISVLVSFSSYKFPRDKINLATFSSNHVIHRRRNFTDSSDDFPLAVTKSDTSLFNVETSRAINTERWHIRSPLPIHLFTYPFSVPTA